MNEKLFRMAWFGLNSRLIAEKMIDSGALQVGIEVDCEETAPGAVDNVSHGNTREYTQNEYEV